MEYETNCSCNHCRLDVSQKKCQVWECRLAESMWIQKHITSDEKMYRTPPSPFCIPHIHCVCPTPIERRRIFLLALFASFRVRCQVGIFSSDFTNTEGIYFHILLSDAYLAGWFFLYLFLSIRIFLCVYFHLFFGC